MIQIWRPRPPLTPLEKALLIGGAMSVRDSLDLFSGDGPDS